MIGRWWPLALALALSSTTAPAFAGGASGVSQQADGPAAVPSHWGRIVTGRLANGVRFAILPRQNNESGVGLLMRNEGGFIAERRPGERGLAHLIEHIFFVSPTVNAPDDWRHFVHLGLPLTYPAPSAGTTSWRETNYFVSTRTTRNEDLDTLLGLLREGTTDLTFRPDAVDDQRADVMREMASRKAGNDIYARYIAAVAPGSPTDMIDAQNSDDVPTASVATIRGLYHRLYRPENMMIVIVGDVDPARIEALVLRRFGRWKAPAHAPAAKPVPRFQADRIAPVSFSGAPDGRRVAMVTVTSALRPPAATRRGQAQAALMEALTTKVISNRLTDGQPEAEPGKVGIHVESGEQGHRLIMLWDKFTAGDWQPAIVGLRRISCDARVEGFSDHEWSRARQDVIRDLEQRTAGMAAMANVELAKDLSHALAAGRDLIPPDELLGLARELMPTISARAGAAWWDRQWHAGIEQVRVEAPELAQTTNAPDHIRETANKAVPTQACKLRRN